VTLAAILSKLLGSAAGAFLGGLPGNESIQLGTGMVARGEVTLIIAAMGVKASLITQGTLSAIVVAVLISTLITPAMLRIVFSKLKPKPPAQSAEEERV
jgi:Kef-type K+ transport system membrane component KefB